MSRGGDRDPGIEEVLRRVSSQGEADVERVLGAVPSMLAEAARRRRAEAAPASLISASARAWLPRLTLATAMLALAALLWPIHPSRELQGDAHSFERWVVTGAAPSSNTDPVLDALMR